MSRTTSPPPTVEERLAAAAEPAPVALRDRVLVATGTAVVTEALPHPLGTACVAWSGAGLRRVDLTDDLEGFAAATAADVAPVVDGVLPDEVRRALLDTFQRGRRYLLPIDWRGTGTFQQEVLDVIVTIPPGELRPYGWVAERIGRPGAARAVGTALARNPVPLVRPCHRVGRADGSVGSYAFGSEAKARLLEHEAAA